MLLIDNLTVVTMDADVACTATFDLARVLTATKIGSGDGMVVHIAALFTEAHGLEADPALVEMARDATRSLGLEERASFFVGDYLKWDLSNFDVLYIYPGLSG